MDAAILFILSCLCYACYSASQILSGTASWIWHGLQWFSALGFVLSGILFGRKLKGMTWHRFGRIVAVAVLGIPVYVFSLHWMLENFKR